MNTIRSAIAKALLPSVLIAILIVDAVKNYWRKALFGVLILAPPAFIAWAIHAYGVNVFYYDQVIDTVPVMAHWINGVPTWYDFWHMDNEHRLFFSKLLTCILGTFTHWDMRADMWAELFLAGITLLNVWIIGRKCGCGKWFIPMANLLIFTPAGLENWDFGHQTCFWIPMACYTATIWMAMTQWRYLGTAVASIIATYSIGGGLICWAVAFPLLVTKTKKGNVRKLILWLIVAVTSCVLYACHFNHRSPTTSPAELWTHWADATMFFLAYFAIPFGKLGEVPYTNDLWEKERLIGICLVIVFGVVAWSRRRDRSAWPIFALASCTIFTAVLTTIARYGANCEGSRYVPFASLFAIATLMLIKNRRVLATVSAVMLLLNMCSVMESWQFWHSRQVFAKADKALFQLIWLLPPERLLNPQTLWLPIPNAKTTLEDMRVIDVAGGMNPPALHSRDIGLISDQLYHPECGGWGLGKTPDGNHLFMVGAAHFGDNLADIVLITVNEKIIDYALIDTVHSNWFYCADGLAKLGWRPQAWAFDGIKHRAYLLPNK